MEDDEDGFSPRPTGVLIGERGTMQVPLVP